MIPICPLRALTCVILGASIGLVAETGLARLAPSEATFVEIPEIDACSSGEGASCCSFEKPDPTTPKIEVDVDPTKP